MTDAAVPKAKPIPSPALTLGLAGLLPFIACAVLSLTADGEAAGLALRALIAYGAVILSFLGGVRWGVAIAGGASPGFNALALSVVPSLIAWPALLIEATPALLLLAAGIAGQYALDYRAASHGELPLWYGHRLRTILSVGVLVCLLLAMVA